MNVGDEQLVDELVHLVEGFQHHLGGNVDLTRTVHDEDGAPLAALEQPLSLDGRFGDALPVVVYAP